jgi:hypothetical protein
MSLIKQLTTGIQKRPHFLGLYGPAGVGKSTWAASAPKPVFIGTDDGVATLDVASFPIPQTWQDVKAAVGDLLMEKHDYETLVIDTINGLEPLVWAHVCKEAKVASIEDVGDGFGKGYIRAREEFDTFFKTLKRLRAKMNVIGLGHSKIKTSEDIYQGEKYDRYILKMDERAGDLFLESVDCMFFANFEQIATKVKGNQKAKMRGEGRRRMFTESRPAFLAKSRFAIPFEMDLSWDAFIDAVAKCVPAAAATEDKLLALFKGREELALGYLVNIGWLEEGQPLSALLAAKRKVIMSKAESFLKHVDEFSKPEPETTETNES